MSLIKDCISLIPLHPRDSSMSILWLAALGLAYVGADPPSSDALVSVIEDAQTHNLTYFASGDMDFTVKYQVLSKSSPLASCDANGHLRWNGNRSLLKLQYRLHGERFPLPCFVGKNGEPREAMLFFSDGMVHHYDTMSNSINIFRQDRVVDTTTPIQFVPSVFWTTFRGPLLTPSRPWREFLHPTTRSFPSMKSWAITPTSNSLFTLTRYNTSSHTELQVDLQRAGNVVSYKHFDSNNAETASNTYMYSSILIGGQHCFYLKEAIAAFSPSPDKAFHVDYKTERIRPITPGPALTENEFYRALPKTITIHDQTGEKRQTRHGQSLSESDLDRLLPVLQKGGFLHSRE